MPNPLYTREREPAFAPVKVDDKGSPYCEIALACPMCSGTGETRWKSDPVCIACDGSGLSARSDRVKLYTLEELDKLDEAARLRLERKAQELAERKKALSDSHGDLLDQAQTAAETSPLAQSILETASRTGRLSDAQIAALERAVKEHNDGACTQYIGTVGQVISTRATVKNITPFKSRYRSKKAARPMSAVTLADSDGNELVAFCAGKFTEGQSVSLTGKIKEHRTWRGARQTIIEKPNLNFC